MKLVYESLYEFGKGVDPKSILGLGEDFYKKEIEKILLNFLSTQINMEPTFQWTKTQLQIIYKNGNNKGVGKYLLDETVNTLLDNTLLCKQLKDLCYQLGINIYSYETVPRNFITPGHYTVPMIIFDFK